MDKLETDSQNLQIHTLHSMLRQDLNKNQGNDIFKNLNNYILTDFGNHPLSLKKNLLSFIRWNFFKRYTCCHFFLRTKVRGDFNIHGTKYFYNAVFHQKLKENMLL